MTGFLSQIMNARTYVLGPLRERKKNVCMIAGLCALTAFMIFESLFRMDGEYTSYLQQGDPLRAIILSSNAQNEADSAIPRDGVLRILKMPGIRIADAEIAYPLHCCMYRKGDPYIYGKGTLVRGWGLNGFSLRSGFKLVAGRMPIPGARELIAGRMAYDNYLHLNPGDDLRLPDGWWTVVGTFSTRTSMESDLIVDTGLLYPGLFRDTYNSVFVQLKSPQSFETLKAALAADRGLSVNLLHQSDYLARHFEPIADSADLPLLTIFAEGQALFLSMVYAVALLAITFSALESGIQDRVHGIAILHAIGFEPVAIALPLILETVTLAVIGICAGGTLAWLLLEHAARTNTGYLQFQPAVTSQALTIGMAVTLLAAIGGAVLPAQNAARVTSLESVLGKAIA